MSITNKWAKISEEMLIQEKYSSGWRGAPAKGVDRLRGARVQIPPSPFSFLRYFFMPFRSWKLFKKIKKVLTKKRKGGMIPNVAAMSCFEKQVRQQNKSKRDFKKSWKKYLTSTKRCAKMIELSRERSGRNLDNWTVTTLKIRENKFWKTNLKQ